MNQTQININRIRAYNASEMMWKQFRRIIQDAAFNESEHPRNENGEFARSNTRRARKTGKNQSRKRDGIRLGRKEYAIFMHEMNTHLTKSDLSEKIVTKNIGEYRYLVKIIGFDNYHVIHKMKIK